VRTKVTGSAILTPLPAPSPERAAEESPASLEDAHSTDGTKITAMVTGTGFTLDGEDNPASVAIGFTDGDTEVDGAETMEDTEGIGDGRMMTPAAASLESRVAEASPASLDLVPQAVMITEADRDMDMEADGTMTTTPAAASLESLEVAENPASPDPVPQAVMTSDMDTDTGDGEVMDTLLDTGVTAPLLPVPNLASQVDVSKSSAVYTISERVSFERSAR